MLADPVQRALQQQSVWLNNRCAAAIRVGVRVRVSSSRASGSTTGAPAISVRVRVRVSGSKPMVGAGCWVSSSRAYGRGVLLPPTLTLTFYTRCYRDAASAAAAREGRPVRLAKGAPEGCTSFGAERQLQP